MTCDTPVPVSDNNRWDDPEQLQVEAEWHDAESRRHAHEARTKREQLLKTVAATMTPQQRREWIRRINTTTKAILVGVCAWVAEQIRDHTVRTAVVGSVGLLGVGTTQIAAEVIEVEAAPRTETVSVVEPAVTISPEIDRPPPAVTADPEPAVTETVVVTTDPDPEIAEVHVDDSPSPPTPEPSEGSATPPVADPLPDLDITAEPPPVQAPTRTSTPTPTRTATPTSTPTPTHEPAECVELPEEHGVRGMVCAPPSELDDEGRWQDCLDGERLRDVLGCLRHPDEWWSPGLPGLS